MPHQSLLAALFEAVVLHSWPGAARVVSKDANRDSGAAPRRVQAGHFSYPRRRVQTRSVSEESNTFPRLRLGWYASNRLAFDVSLLQ